MKAVAARTRSTIRRPFLDIFVDVGAGTAEGREIGRDFIAGFEKIIGGQGDDHLVSGSEPIQMAGGEGDDTFEFKSSDDDHQPDLVRKITDFTYGDRIIAARYEIFYRTDEGLAEEQSTICSRTSTCPRTATAAPSAFVSSSSTTAISPLSTFMTGPTRKNSTPSSLPDITISSLPSWFPRAASVRKKCP